MRYRAARILAMVLLLASASAVVGSQGSGAIEGQVLNATSGEVPVEGLPVTLWAIDSEAQSILSRGSTDSEGRFLFEGLDTQAYSYQVQTTYQVVSYWSQVLAFSTDQNRLSAPIAVYETTLNAADLLVERAHLILDPSPGRIQVQELQILVNDGNRTYVGPDGEGGHTLHFALPQGAAELQLPEALVACCIVLTPEGFAYTRPVVPGTKEFFFSYELAYQSSDFTLYRSLDYPTRHLEVLVADMGVEVSGPGLIAQETVSLQDGTYQHLSVEGLSPGEDLTLHFARLPMEAQARGPGRSASPILVRAVMSLGTLATILFLAYPFFKKRQGETS